jgi:hypothetical protein
VPRAAVRALAVAHGTTIRPAICSRSDHIRRNFETRPNFSSSRLPIILTNGCIGPGNSIQEIADDNSRARQSRGNHDPAALEVVDGFLLDVPVIRIELRQPIFERVNVVEFEFTLSDHLYAFHDFDEPPSRLELFVAKEERFLPLGEHQLFRLRLAIPNNENLP